MNEALHKFNTTPQDKYATCSEYMKKFQTVLDVINPVSGTIDHNTHMETKLIKETGMMYPVTATTYQRNKAPATASQNYPATALTMESY